MNRNIVMFTSFLGFISFSGLFGCKPALNTTQICIKNPELCADLHKDSWCRYEKGDLIRNRFRLKNTPDPQGEEIYQQLLLLESYNNCIELAAGVQHILHPQRTNDRARAFGLSSQTLAELQETTKGSKDPHLAYYHWSRFNDSDAENILFTAERNGEIHDVALKALLASRFIKFNPEKAKSIYFDLLETSSEDDFSPDWILGLANIYRHQGNLEMYYLLSKTNIELTGASYSEKQMLAVLKGDLILQEKLDDEAEDLASELLSGKLAESKLKIVLESELYEEKP